jgi:phosphopantothenoylcysteine decarboxylase/phosphopantothenate--cysteine ligase
MLVRGLISCGAEVQVVLSANARQFVTATTLQAVSGRPVRDDLWDEQAEAAMGHIELARWADRLLIAPATANTIAKLAHGLADDLLSTLVLATDAPVSLAPAMNQAMYRHPATQANLALLESYGYSIIGPDSGEQACGDEGPGRMTEPEDLVDHLLSAGQSATQHLAGFSMMVTTGPTQEAIDPVRYISNHSSGLQGLSIAEAARDHGAEVTLIAGPRVPESHPDIRRIDVTSALDMHQAVMDNLRGVDIFVGVAAVADYRPTHPEDRKIKRHEAGDDTMRLELTENPDIIASVAKTSPRPLVIGFAAETNDTLENARAKRLRKGIDAIVLNDVADRSIGFNSPDNAATLIYAGGEVVFPKQSKQQLARGLIGQLLEIFASQLADTNRETVTK